MIVAVVLFLFLLLLVQSATLAVLIHKTPPPPPPPPGTPSFVLPSPSGPQERLRDDVEKAASVARYPLGM